DSRRRGHRVVPGDGGYRPGGRSDGLSDDQGATADIGLVDGPTRCDGWCSGIRQNSAAPQRNSGEFRYPSHRLSEPLGIEGRFVNILVIDIGGTNVKLLASGQETPRKFKSGPDLTPERMVAGAQEATKDWDYQAVTIGFPGP